MKIVKILRTVAQDKDETSDTWNRAYSRILEFKEYALGNIFWMGDFLKNSFKSRERA